MSDASGTTRTPSENERLDRHLHDLGWGLLFVLTGLLWLLPSGRVPEGTWLFGVAAILLGVNFIRYAMKIPVSSFSVLLGLIALLAAASQWWGVDLPLVALCLIVIGVSLVVRPLVARKHPG